MYYLTKIKQGRMIIRHYKCTLKTDVVLNASLATEGNMETLDYIPGSNFLGIVANQIYQNYMDQAVEVLHNGHVSFGDGIIYNDEVFYPMPNCFLQDKLEKKIVDKEEADQGKKSDAVYLDFNIDHKKGVLNKHNQKRQLKQMRSGFISASGKIITEIPKSFSLKSAYDRANRRTDEGKMFGFEAIEAGTQFLFSINFKDENHIQIVENALLGNKRIGKSKSAEYGQVLIEHFDKSEIEIEAQRIVENVTIVYAQSNLCFIDKETGQQTFQPTADQLGVPGGKVVWDKSQIRTFTYSPWNFQRNASSMQRHCIKMGSVFYVEGASAERNENQQIGEFYNEGLGRVIYDPIFLKSNPDDERLTSLSFVKADLIKEEIGKNSEPVAINTSLGHFLKKQKDLAEAELKLAKEINEAIEKYKDTGITRKVTSSQWGNIRAVATDFLINVKTWEEFMIKLGLKEGEKKNGLLTCGKMAEKLWDERNIKDIKELLTNIQNENKLLFTIKFSSEMAKEAINFKNKKQ
ncbi:MAG TPA: hypothetical protein PLU49_01910 [Saprospiraceae bacterium]|nr:hypothetical protein [Saprospiraceae bacterium]